MVVGRRASSRCDGGDESVGEFKKSPRGSTRRGGSSKKIVVDSPESRVRPRGEPRKATHRARVAPPVHHGERPRASRLHVRVSSTSLSPPFSSDSSSSSVRILIERARIAPSSPPWAPASSAARTSPLGEAALPFDAPRTSKIPSASSSARRHAGWTVSWSAR